MHAQIIMEDRNERVNEVKCGDGGGGGGLEWMLQTDTGTDVGCPCSASTMGASLLGKITYGEIGPSIGDFKAHTLRMVFTGCSSGFALWRMKQKLFIVTTNARFIFGIKRLYQAVHA